MKIRFKITSILATFIILYCNGGIMSFIKGSSAVTLLIYCTMILWIGLVLIKDRKFLSKCIYICYVVAIMWIIVNMCSLFAGENVSILVSRMSKNLMFLLLFVIIMIYYSAPHRKAERKMILTVWGIDTICTSIYTLYRLIDTPTLSRIIATGTPEQYISANVSLSGVWSFGSIYGLVFIVIMLMGLMNKVKIAERIILIFILFLLIYTIIQAQFFIATVLCALGLILSLFVDKKNIKIAKIMVLFIPAIIVICNLLVTEWLPALASTGILPPFIAKRLLLFLNGVTINELLTTARGVVYLKSLNAIKESWGIGMIFFKNIMTGEHSELLDLFAVYGFPIAILLLYGLYRVFQYIFSVIPKESSDNYRIICCLYLFMCLLNTSLWCQTTVIIFLIIPLTYIQLYSRGDKGR